MNEILKLPHAEIYSFNFPQNKKDRKNIALYVENNLKEKHPGFTSSSLWDFCIVTNRAEKLIKAVVLDRNYYVEKRLRNKKVIFKIQIDKHQTKSVFSSIKYNKEGNKRKVKIPMYYFIIFVVLLSILLIKKNINKIITNEVVVEEEKNVEQKITDVNSVLDFVNYCAQIIYNNGAKIKKVEVAIETKNIIKFSVVNCEPYVLVDSLSDIVFISNCKCTDLFFENGKESFDIEIELEQINLYLDVKTDKKILQLQHQIVEALKNNNIEILNSRVNETFGKISFQIKETFLELGKTNKYLNDLCKEKNLFITKFSEMQNEEEYLIELEVIPLKQEQQIKNLFSEEIISKVFLVKEKNRKEKRNPIKTVAIENKKNNEKLEKIGNVKKDGKEYFYYKNEDGKIYVLDEEL